MVCRLEMARSGDWVWPFRWFWKVWILRKKNPISQWSELLLSVHWRCCPIMSVGNSSACTLTCRLPIKRTHQTSWMLHARAAGGKCCLKGEKRIQSVGFSKKNWPFPIFFMEVNGKPVCFMCLQHVSANTTFNTTIKLIMPRITITSKTTESRKGMKIACWFEETAVCFQS